MAANLEYTIVDESTGQPVHARVYVTSADGEHLPIDNGIQFSKGEETHTIVQGGFTAEVPAGEITVRVERGLEYTPIEKSITLADGELLEHTISLSRWIDMSGWYAGDLHVHRDWHEMPELILAEDLHIGTNITVHNHKSAWVDEPKLSQPIIPVDDTHFVSVCDQEIERLFTGGGAIIFLGLSDPVTILVDHHSPTDIHLARLAKKAGAHVDAEKPFWHETPVNVALGGVDSMGVVTNHFHRQKIMLGAEEWGAWPREFDHTHWMGFVLWFCDLYSRFLNCGFQLGASAGTASGIMPSPVGYNRAYVHFGDAPLSYESWFERLKAGRSFATNGPILKMSVSGREIGDTVKLGSGSPPVEVVATARGLEPIDRLELVHNGDVIAEATPNGDPHLVHLESEVVVGGSGWLAIRAFAPMERTIRFAHTSPVYLSYQGRPVADAEAARYFAGRIEELILQVSREGWFPSSQAREEALSYFRQAVDVYRQIEATAGELAD